MASGLLGYKKYQGFYGFSFKSNVNEPIRLDKNFDANKNYPINLFNARMEYQC